MVCNLVTYRARSAVREVGYALGFPRPLVDRVAKALETYDSVMVRRDLEADGGFAEFFRRPGEGEAGVQAEDAVRAPPPGRASVASSDRMGQLAHGGGRRWGRASVDPGGRPLSSPMTTPLADSGIASPEDPSAGSPSGGGARDGTGIGLGQPVGSPRAGAYGAAISRIWQWECHGQRQRDRRRPGPPSCGRRRGRRP